MTLNPLYSDYRTIIDGLPCYIAGLPTFPRNFSRDGFLAGYISMDEDILRKQIAFSAARQGIKIDILTGEEPGKVHHEWPGVSIPRRGTNLLTTYNACDTTSFFLLAIEGMKVFGTEVARSITQTYRANIEEAAQYLLRHIRNGIFYEWPPPPAKRFELHVTYWKDSVLPRAKNEKQASYPIAYALPHFLAARALLSVAALLERDEWREEADKLFKRGIETFITEEQFVVAKEAAEKTEIAHSSSDELHILAYTPRQYAKLLPLTAIQKRAKELETNIGYACNPVDIDKLMNDRYHGHVVWPFEQAMIHYGAKKFGLSDCVAIAEKVLPYIDTGHELLTFDNGIVPAGNPRQLWSVAAEQYFLGNSLLCSEEWL